MGLIEILCHNYLNKLLPIAALCFGKLDLFTSEFKSRTKKQRMKYDSENEISFTSKSKSRKKQRIKFDSENEISF